MGKKKNIDVDVDLEKKDKKKNVDKDSSSSSDSSSDSDSDNKITNNSKRIGKRKGDSKKKPDVDIDVDLNKKKPDIDLDLDKKKPDLDINLGEKKPDLDIDLDLNKKKPDIDLDLNKKKPDLDIDLRKKKPDIDIDLDLNKKKPDLDINLNKKKPDLDIDLGKKKPDVDIDLDLNKKKPDLDLDLPKKKPDVDIDLDLNKKKPDIDVDLNKKKPDLDLDLPKKKPDLDIDLPKKKPDIDIDLNKKKPDLDLDLPKKKPDIDLDLNKKKPDLDIDLHKKKPDLDLDLPKKKPDVDIDLDLNKKKPDIDVDLNKKKPDLDLDLPKKKPDLDIDLGKKKPDVDIDLDLNKKKPDLDIDLHKKKPDLDLDLPKKKPDLDIDLGKKKPDLDLDIGRKKKTDADDDHKKEKVGVEITIIEATNLPAVKKGSINAFVRVLYGPEITVKTGHVNKNLNPKWHKHFALKGKFPKIIFEVLDHTSLIKDSLVGFISYNLEHLNLDQEVDVWEDIKKGKEGPGGGKLHFKLNLRHDISLAPKIPDVDLADLNRKAPDVDVDVDHKKKKPDLDLDVDLKKGKPDLDIDVKVKKPDIDVDLGKKKPDVDIDVDHKKKKPDVDVDVDAKDKKIGLEVTVVEAKDLPSMDRGGTSDPFVRILYGPDITVKTGHVNKNLNPKWHKHFALKGKFPKIIFEVFDHDTLGKNQLIGYVAFNLGSLEFDHEIDLWEDIKKGKEGPGGGKLHFKLNLRHDISLAPKIPDVDLVDLNRKAPDVDVDVDHKKKPDLDIDLDLKRAKPDLDIDIDLGKKKPDLDIDVDLKKKKPDVDVDVDAKDKNIGLEVTVIEAKDLPSMDRGGTSDPFVRILYGPEITVKTGHVNKNLNPKWHKHFALKGKFPKIIFEVFDHDTLGKNQLIGYVAHNLGSLEFDHEIDLWEDIKKGKEGPGGGKLHFKLNLRHDISLAPKIPDVDLVDLNRKAPDVDVDVDHKKKKPDLDLDIDLKKGKPDLDIDVKVKKPDIDVDLGKKKPDLDIDLSKKKPDLDIDIDVDHKKKKPDVDVDVDAKEKKIGLEVTVIEAKDLPAMDRGGTSDPFVRILYGPEITVKTGHVNKNLNPKWHKHFALKGKFPKIIFEVFDHDTLGKNQLIGYVAFNLGSLEFDHEIDLWEDIKKGKEGPGGGKLHFKLNLRHDISLAPKIPDVDLVDLNRKAPDVDVDVDHKKKPDLDIDLDLKRAKPDLDIDVKVKKPDIDVDLGKKKPDIDVDLGKKKPDLDIDVKVKKPDVDIDLSKKKPDLDIDVDLGKKKPDVDIKKPDVDIDVDAKNKKIGLEVTVVEAKDLPAMDRGGTSDPFVRILYGPEITVKTGHVNKNLNPKWHKHFALKGKFPKIIFEVFDHDTLGKNQLIGYVAFNLGSLEFDHEIDLWEDIKKGKEGPGGGKLNFKLNLRHDISLAPKIPDVDLVDLNRKAPDVDIDHKKKKPDLDIDLDLKRAKPDLDIDIDLGKKKPDLDIDAKVKKPDVDIDLGKKKPNLDIDVDLKKKKPDVDVDVKVKNVDIDLSKKKPDLDIDVDLKKKKPDVDVDVDAKEKKIGLEVTVIEAKDLPAMDRGGTSDPFVRILYGPEITVKTGHVNKNLNPKWHKHFALKGKFPKIIFEVFDHDTLGKNSMIGYVVHNIGSLEFDHEIDLWEDIKKGKEGPGGGKLHFKLTLRHDISLAPKIPDVDLVDLNRKAPDVDVDVDHKKKKPDLDLDVDLKKGKPDLDIDVKVKKPDVDIDLGKKKPDLDIDVKVKKPDVDVDVDLGKNKPDLDVDLGKKKPDLDIDLSKKKPGLDIDVDLKKKPDVDIKKPDVDIDVDAKNKKIGLEVTVVEAKDLPAMDRGGTSDPFVRILYGPEITVKTGHVNKNLNPKWHKHFALKGKFPKIIFEVFDHDTLGKNTMIGYVAFNLGSLNFDQEIDLWEDIKKGKEGPGGGKLHFKLVLRADISLAPKIPDVDLVDLNRKAPNVDVDVDHKKKKPDLDIDIDLKKGKPDLDIDVDLGKKKPDVDIDVKVKKPDLDIDLGKKKPDLDIDLSKKKPDLDLDLGKKKPDLDIDIDLKKKKPDVDVDVKDKIGLEVTVVEAKDLPAMDRGGTSDPFVRILYGPEITVKTGHVNKNLNPKWHKHFALKGKFPKIIFEVFDHDTLGKNSMIGYVAFNLGSLNFDQEIDLWEDIKKGKEGPGGGKLHFKLNLRHDISLAPKIPDVDLVDLNKKAPDVDVDVDHKTRTPDLDVDIDLKKKKPDLDIDIDLKKGKPDLDIDLGKKKPDVDIDLDLKKKKPDIDVDIDRKKKPEIGLEVTVVEAKDLPAMDRGGTSDPFVRILYGPEITVKTGHVNKNLNPKWHKHFALKGKFPKIIFEVFDHDTLGKDSMIGYVAFNLGSLNFDQEIDLWEDIKKGKEGPGGGKLHFKLVLRADISLAPKIPDVDLVDLNRKAPNVDVDVDHKKKKPDLDVDLDLKKAKPDIDIDLKKGTPDLDIDLGKKKPDLDIDVDLKKKPDIDIDLKKKKPDAEIGLEVTVIEAKDLPAMDRGGTSDPFVRILYGPEITVKTGHVNKNLNPKWHKHFALKGKFPKIIFEVFDHDAIGRDSMIGYVAFSIGSLNFDHEIDLWEDIKKGKEGPGGGKLHFKLTLRNDISLAPKIPDVDLVDLNKKAPDVDVDVDHKKKPDLDIDIDFKKGKPDLDIDVDLGKKKKLDVDVGHMKKPDLDVDLDVDKKKKKPDVDIDVDHKKKKPDLDIDIDVDKKKKRDIDVDIDVDKKKKPDLDIDIDVDKKKKKPDLDIDIDVDKKKKKPDVDVDTDKNVKIEISKPAIRWMPDDASLICLQCKAPFTFFNRRHHCRSCGRLFDNKCCSNMLQVPGNKSKQRVCISCFKQATSK